MNRGKGEQQSSQPAREFLRWTDDMDSRLIDAMIEEARLGNRVDGTWTTQAYNNIVQALHNAGVSDVSKNNVKNRLKTLKDKWREVHDLFKGTSGFAYSPLTKTFEAEDIVWDELIRVRMILIKIFICSTSTLILMSIYVCFIGKTISS